MQSSSPYAEVQMDDKVSTLRCSIHVLALALAAAMAVGASASTATAQPTDKETPPAALKLHVPSPDWRDQVIYFLMTDRFADGNPGNNDQGANEFDPKSNAKYSGGDLAGIQQHLDYIQGLGATAVWITPPVANQWWNMRIHYGGYHGYWAEDLMRVDAHLGTLQEYKELSHALHNQGMYLVQDVVVNHMGDYFSYGDTWDKQDPTIGFRRIADSNGMKAPTQVPFDQNDVRDPAHRKAAIYHWTPAITNYSDAVQLQDFQLADLDDLDTENPVVRDALRESYGFWIREVGVDAFRVDTAFYVLPEYFADFMHSGDAAHPGMATVAAQTGRNNFHVFGEGFGIDKPFEDIQARRIDGYMRGKDGAALLPGMINFPLYGTLGDVFARGRPPAELAHRIGNMMKVHADPHLMPTFVDNHDVDRFLSGGNEAGLMQSLLLMMTLPGIPTIYYGTEQGFSKPRAAMFAQGAGSGGRDHFDTNAPLYRFIQRATALRREHPLFSRGVPTVLQGNAAGPGVLAYRMDHDGESAVVVFNTSDRDTLMDNLDTGAAPGAVLQGLFGIDKTPADVIVGDNARIHLQLPARSGQVWKIRPSQVTATAAPAALTLDALPARSMKEGFLVQGHAPGSNSVQVVVDGDLAAARTAIPDADGHWQSRVEITSMIDPDVGHDLVAWDAARGIASERQSFKASPQWKTLAEVDDPAADDAGPEGRYRYPSDPAYRVQRPLDIEHVRVQGAEGAIKIALRMHDVVNAWNPANGFDHVAFVVFLQVPGKDGGTTSMPLQNAELPEGMRWNYRLRTHGWTNALFSSDGASATQEGTPVTPAAHIQADPEAKTVTLTLPASALGGITSLSGVKLYVATWDYDGGFRKLAPDLSTNSFSGGDGKVDPLVMDDVLITLP